MIVAPGMTGTQILHYRVGERLGAGAMGEVFAAEDVRLGRRVALKFLPRSIQHDESSRARLLKEARAASVLTSPNVAATYDIGEFDGSPFLVMELVEGELLSTRIARGPLVVDDVLDIALQIADALQDAHAHGVVHRDIKSANLMVTGRGLVKVLDFGLAKFLEPIRYEPSGAIDASQQQTLVGTLVGTLFYMSPEQALGRSVDHRTDLFSTGVVMYEMLTGRLPFHGATLTGAIDRIVHGTPPAMARFDDDARPALERVVRKLLAKDPDDRYQSARDLAIDLRQERRDLRGDERTPSPAPPPLQNVIAVMTFVNISKDASDDWIGSGMAETVTADLKRVQGLAVIGRERMYDALKHLRAGEVREVDDRIAIEVGRVLGASWIVAGGYQRVGGQIRMTARLVDITTGALATTVKIDGLLTELFALQDRIVFELTQWLDLGLARSEVRQIERAETSSVEAYEDYSRGMMNMRRATRESLDRAMYLFERAVERDPRYAIAWAALGEAYEVKATMLGLSGLAQKSITCLERAVEIDPRLANAHAELAWALLAAARHDEAIVAARDAVRLEPANARGHAALARAYWAGKGMIDEGIGELEQTAAINPDAGYALLQLGLLYTLRGEYERAEHVCRRAIDLQEQYISGREGLLVMGARTRLGYVFYRSGRYDEALREYERELTFLGTTDHALRERNIIEINQKMGAAHLRMGNLDEAHRRLDAAITAFDQRRAQGSDDPFTTYYVACALALKGDAENAARHLRETFGQLRALNTWRARHDPDFDGIREHPAFIAALADHAQADT